MGANIAADREADREADHDVSQQNALASGESSRTYGAREPLGSRPTGSSGPPHGSRQQVFWTSFRHAWDGLEYAVATQRNMRIHLAVAAAALALGLVVQLTLEEFALVLLTILAVLSAELFNTAVESLVDLVTDEHHELARAAKDVAAGAVLLTAIFAVVIGCAVYGPHLLILFFAPHGN